MREHFEEKRLEDRALVRPLVHWVSFQGVTHEDVGR